MAFYGSSEEEAIWREELRRQVEEDLERQVRLRLGLGLEGRQRTLQDEEVDILSRYEHACRQSITSTEKAVKLPKVTVGVQGEEGKVCVRSGRVQGEEGKVCVRSGRRQETTWETECLTLPSISHGDKTRLFRYLSKHHGPPLSQLQQLSCTGAYETCGGGGRGEGRGEGGRPDGIQWPVEAAIILPTPHHITSSHPVPSQPPLSSSAQLSSQLLRGYRESGSSTEEGEGSNGGEVVYVCGREEVGWKERGLVFESRFESGNLYQARQIGAHEYTLVLTPDLYTKRHVQWYYFRVTNMETTPTYTFHIVNFEKTDSLYNSGMQPLLYSESEASSTGIGWTRVGWNVAYHQSRFHYPPHMSPDHSYFTLTWSMQFHHHGDTCYIAHCYPYPLSSLYRLLGNIEQDSETAKYIHREELCQTLAGNSCPLLTITEFDGQEEGEEGRRGVVITARVHPGETNSSWMMEGLIKFLTSNSAHAQALRQSFVFKLVPMLNPDGVVVGNYRTSLTGVDLNRVYKTPVKDLFPTIYHTKRMMERFRREREVCVYVDLHGHSRKHNVFMYGCRTPKADHTHFLHDRLLPYLLSQQAPSKFCFASCKFAVQRCKEATGRVVTWRSGVPNSFTLEATFSGSNLGPSKWQFRERDLCEMGCDLGEALYKFYKCIHSKTYQLKVMARLAEEVMAKLATPTDYNPSPNATLPDVVTSTTSHTSHFTHRHSSHHHKKHAQHTLHRFRKLDIHQLQLESSTSGSDSENEDFKFRKKSRKHKHCQRQQRSFSVPQIQSPLSAPLLSSRNSLTHHPPSNTTKHPELTLPSLLAQATPTKQWMRGSAPARLSPFTHAAVGTGSKRKFVNRYANRSNGGIPMFAEERLKERTEKRLRSMSEVVHLPPAPSSPNMATVRKQKMDHTHPSSLTCGPRPLSTYCPDSIPQETKRLQVSPRQQHYQHIKELMQHNHTLPHNPWPPTATSRALLPTSHIPTSHLPTSHLPSHLISYINEVWISHNRILTQIENTKFYNSTK